MRSLTTPSGTLCSSARRRLPRRVTTLIVPAALLALVALPPVAQAAGRDSDGDKLSDHYELTVSHTNPHRADTDNDGLSDGYEIRYSMTNPLTRDTDKDGLSDRRELFPPAYPRMVGFALRVPNFTVREPKTNPRRRDTDGDGLTDGYEVLTSFTSPVLPDTDGDSFSDGEEVLAGSDPLDAASHPSSTTHAPIDITAPSTSSTTTPSSTTPLPSTMPTPVDTTAPDTSIVSGPSGTVSSSAASFGVSSTEAGSTLQCRLDGGAWSACTSPKAYSGLADGSHTFDVRATDAAGNTDATPATRTWTINTTVPDTTAPDTSIASGPSGTVSSSAASFGVSSTEAGSTLQCRLDGGAWSACTSPKAYSGLADGSHTFDVRATDAAGNTDATPATRTWTINTSGPDTTAPDTSIASGPSGTVSSSAASFGVSSTEAGSTLQCRLDGGAWSACTSPKAYSGLADGSHTFDVRATDAAGNTDATPATRTWTINTSGTGPRCATQTLNAFDGPDPWGGCFPGPSNTGVLAGTVLSAYTGPSTISTANTVIDGKTMGCIDVTAPGVVIRNSKVSCPSSRSGYAVFSRDGGFSGTPLLIEDSEIDCANTNGTALGEALFTAIRVNIHGCENGGDLNQNITIQDSYVHDLYNSAAAHTDGFQMGGGHYVNGQVVAGALNVTFDHNTIFGIGADGSFGRTSAIISNRGGDTNILIQNNLLAGGAFTLYCEQGAKGNNYRVISNAFTRAFSQKVGFFGGLDLLATNYRGRSALWHDPGRRGQANPAPPMLRGDEVYAAKLALAGPWAHVPEILGSRQLDRPVGLAHRDAPRGAPLAGAGPRAHRGSANARRGRCNPAQPRRCPPRQGDRRAVLPAPALDHDRSLVDAGFARMIST